MSTLAVGAITDASGGATATINGYTPTASNMAGRNRIINGDMRIDQRNAGAAVTVGTNTYHVDRFYSSNETATGTITGQQLSLGASRSFRVLATAAITDLTGANQFKGIAQTIESQNIFDLNAKTITVSFKVDTNWTGNLAVCFRNSANDRSYVVDAAIVSGTNNVSVTLSLEATSILTSDSSSGLQLFIGGNTEGTRQTATTGSWLAGVFIVSTSSTQWTKTLNNFINVTEVQLEEGSVATPFEHRSYGTELALCQRYLPAFRGTTTNTPLGAGYCPNSVLIDVVIPFVVPTRADVTGIVISAAGDFSQLMLSDAITAVTINSVGNTSCNVRFTTTGVASFQANAIRLNTASAFIYFTGAEL